MADKRALMAGGIAEAAWASAKSYSIPPYARLKPIRRIARLGVPMTPEPSSFTVIQLVH
jgi:hypothetical protein